MTEKPSGDASTAARTTAARSSPLSTWYSPSEPFGVTPSQPQSASQRMWSRYRSRSTRRSASNGSAVATRTPCQAGDCGVVDMSLLRSAPPCLGRAERHGGQDDHAGRQVLVEGVGVEDVEAVVD